jgi:hypothetical protein
MSLICKTAPRLCRCFFNGNIEPAYERGQSRVLRPDLDVLSSGDELGQAPSSRHLLLHLLRQRERMMMPFICSDRRKKIMCICDETK